MPKNKQACAGKDGEAVDAGSPGGNPSTGGEKPIGIFDNLPFVLIALNGEGEVRCWNSMAEILFNIRRSEALGKPFKELGAQLNWTEVMQSMDSTFQDSEYADVHKEVRYTRNDGTTGFMDLRVINFLDVPENSEQMILIVGIDITEFKVMQGQLGQAQKLEAIGQLASGIAHEINTPAQYVSDNLRFLKDSVTPLHNLLVQLRDVYERVKSDLPAEKAESTEALFEETEVDFFLQEIPRALEQSIEGMERISRIVLSVKQFAHPGEEEKTWLDLNAIVQNAVTVTRNAWKYDAEMELDLQEDLPQVMVIRGGMNQILLNLIINAADAIKEKGGGKGLITIKTRSGPETFTISVSDTGTGMSEATRERVFEPFFTTKEVGKGTGQGLSIVHSIVVDQHGGNIRLDSSPSEGTTFTVSLPRS